jgi:hypothetical protein
VRTVARRRVSTERRSAASSRMDTILHGWTRTEESEARERERSCGHAVIEVFRRRGRRERRDTWVCGERSRSRLV